MSTAVAQTVSKGLTKIESLADLQSVASIFVKSGFFSDAKDAAQAVVKIMAGGELGFPPIASMTGIYIVKGKVSLSANLMAAAIKRTGRYDYRVRQLDDTMAEIEFFQNGQSLGKSSFTMAEAKAAELTSNPTWKKFPRNMLFARALSNGARWYCPDVFGGPIYTPEELGAPVNEEGEVIDTAPAHDLRVVEPQPAPVEVAQPQSPRDTLKQIIAELKEAGITKAEITARISELCDGNTSWNGLSDWDVAGLIEDFTAWKAALVSNIQMPSPDIER
jgi:hypothetical protein